MITHTVDGVVYAQQADVLEQLGPDVTVAMLRQWCRRNGVRRIRTGQIVWYDLTAAIEAEHATRTSGHGRPRSSSRPVEGVHCG